MSDNPAFQNFTPKANPPGITAQTAIIDDDTDITDPAKLREFTRKELIRVVRRNTGSLGVVPAIRELMDRLDGKPAQSVNLDATVNHVTVTANISFIPVVRDKVIEGVVDNCNIIENQ